MDRSLDDLSASELFEMARQKEKAEREDQLARRRAQSRLLRTQRRQLIRRQAGELRRLQAAHAAELEKIDIEINKLGSSRRSHPGNSHGQVQNQTDQILAILVEGGDMSARDIQQIAQSRGIELRNVHQTLAYLKRQKQAEVISRGVYRACS